MAFDKKAYQKTYAKEWYKLNGKDRWLKRRYGVTSVQVTSRIQEQNNLCALCAKPFGESRPLDPVIDHDHYTGLIRGILHRSCNLAIGILGDSLQDVERASDYLRRHYEATLTESVDEHY